MVYQIEDQKLLLANKEREEAWREMAKQVAHEVKIR
jgi:nitrogen fixation/metabolism regulation signal transduction histidine kinase